MGTVACYREHGPQTGTRLLGRQPPCSGVGRTDPTQPSSRAVCYPFIIVIIIIIIINVLIIIIFIIIIIIIIIVIIIIIIFS